MSAPVVLLFGLEGDKGKAWRTAATHLRIRMRQVPPAEADLPLLELLREDGGKAPSPLVLPLSEPMLVMAGFSRELMDAYLAAARTMGAQRLDLKAVLTPTNASWTARQLQRELAAERDAVAAKRQAHTP